MCSNSDSYVSYAVVVLAAVTTLKNIIFLKRLHPSLDLSISIDMIFYFYNDNSSSTFHDYYQYPIGSMLILSHGANSLK